MHETPDILDLLDSAAWAAVLGCNRQLRQLVHNRAKSITVNSTKDVAALLKRKWLQLSLIIVKARFTRDYEWPENNNLQLLAELHVDGEWSTDQASQCWDARPRSWCGGWVFVVCPMSRIQQADFAREQHVRQALVHLQGAEYSHVDSVFIQHDSCNAAATTCLSTFHWPRLEFIVVCNVQLGEAAMQS